MIRDSLSSTDTKHSEVRGTVAQCVMTLDREHKIQSINQDWLHYSGWKATQLLGRPVLTLVSEADHRHVSLQLEGVGKTGKSALFDSVFEFASGEQLSTQCNASMMVTHQGEIISLTASQQPAVHSAELYQSDDIELFRKAAQAAKFGYWSVDLKTHQLFWSKEVYAIHGLSEQEYTPTINTAIKFYHPEDRDEVRKLVNQGMRDRRPWQFQLRLVRPDGELRVVRCLAEIDEASQGSAAKMYGVCQDVTDYEDLSQQVKLLSKVAAVSITGITICDSEKRVLWINQAFENITGYTLEEVAGKNLGRILQGEETCASTVETIRSFLQQQSDVDVEILNYHKSGKPYWVHLLISPLITNGVVSHFIAIQHDITEQKQQQEMLARRMKMQAIGQVAGKVCHDINNIMAIVSGNTQLLRLHVQGDNASKCLRSIDTATERAVSLTRKLITLVRERSRAQELFALDALIEQQIQMVSGTLPQSVKLDYSLNAACEVKTDKVAMMDAIASMVRNAVDAISKTGSIHITSQCRSVFSGGTAVVITEPSPSSLYAKISISDNGHGIENAEIKRIFDPFYTTREEHSRAGLGLSVLLEFCTQQGFGITVESNPSQSTTFSLWLPCEPKVESL